MKLFTFGHKSLLTKILVIAAALTLSACVKKAQVNGTKSVDGVFVKTIHGVPVDANDNEVALADPSILTKYLALATGFESQLSVPGIDFNNSGTQFALEGGGNAYTKRCVDNDVPIPSIPFPGSWINAGEIPNNRLNILTNLKTTLYYKEYDNGVCAALPRVKSNGTLEALGIICQSSSNGNACFWDNVYPPGHSQAGQKMKNYAEIQPELMSDASNLKENCSECHRGSNVFIVHRETPLDKIADNIPDETYTPLGDKKFGNATGLEKIAPNCSNNCHNVDDAGELGSLTSGYCGAVLIPSITARVNSDGSVLAADMPPIDETKPDDFAEDIQNIIKACSAL